MTLYNANQGTLWNVPAGNIQESVPLSQRAKEPKTLDEMNEKVPTLSELHNKNNFLA